jgi:hypothetical protein
MSESDQAVEVKKEDQEQVKDDVAEEEPKQRSRQKRFRKRKRDSEEEAEDDPDVMLVELYFSNFSSCFLCSRLTFCCHRARLEETKEFINTRERKHGVNMSADSVGYSTARRKRDDEVVVRLEDNFKTSQMDIPEKLDKRMYVYAHLCAKSLEMTHRNDG